jgi:CheY-like chemotaxis protein
MAEGRVLIVDDSEFILEMLQMFFENEGFQTETAVGGTGALGRLLGGDLPDVVLLDVRMPGVDGWDVLARLRSEEHTSDLAVVMMSTEDEEAGWVKSLRAGAQAYLRKPFTPTAAIDAVRDLLPEPDALTA